MATPSPERAVPACTSIAAAIVRRSRAAMVPALYRLSGPARGRTSCPRPPTPRVFAEEVAPGPPLAGGLDQGREPPAPGREGAVELAVRLRAREQRGQAVGVPHREEAGIVCAEEARGAGDARRDHGHPGR